MNQLPLPRPTALIAIAIAIVCSCRSAHAGVITQSSWESKAVVASANVPTDSTPRPTLGHAERGGMEGVPSSSSGGSPTVALPTNLIQIADTSATGRLAIVDHLLPDDPFLDGHPKPA